MLIALGGIALGVTVVVLITALTGYFVAQEFAYMAVDRSRLTASAESGDRAAGRALAITRRTSFMLSGAQLGITVTGLLVGYIAEPLIGQGLATLLAGANVPSGLGVAFGAAVSLLVCTVVQMLFGELFPKNLAIARPEPLARSLSVSTTVYLRLFGWLIWIFDQSSNLLLRALRIEPVHDVEHSATPRDLAHIVATSRDTGDIPGELSLLLDRILDFPTSTAEHAMIPRTRVDTVGADESISAVVSRMATGHTRYPVVGESTDDILGVIDLHDLLDSDQTGTAVMHCRPAVTVPASLPLPQVVTQLTAAKTQMALVIDEYGGFAGIITVEDIAEELVGEITDEHDPDAGVDVVQQEDGWLMPGRLHLDEAQRILNEQLPAGDYETLAGLLMANWHRLPAVGDAIEIELPRDGGDPGAPSQTLLATVRSVDKRVPASVFVSVHNPRPVYE
jgi:CBS domain containing-hemolysin-like protein